MADAYGRFLWSFQAKFSGPGKPISQKFIAIRAILNSLYTLMLKKMEKKSKNFRRSSTLMAFKTCHFFQTVPFYQG